MNISLIYRVNAAVPENLGVLLKMDGQQKAFNQLGHVCDVYYHRNGDIIKRDHEGREFILETVTYKNRSFSFKDFFNALSKVSNITNADLLYIRYPFSTPAFLNFVRRFKKDQIVIEMPTYPYQKEWKGLSRMFLGVDKYYSAKLKDYCQAIVHYGKEQEIFNIKTIASSNGVDTSLFPLVQNNRAQGLKMIAVGKFNYWHGLDRLISGIAGLSDKELLNDIELKVVGEGEVISTLKQQVVNLGLQGNVIFCGVKRGKELDELFNQSNLGIGTLAIHRKDVIINSSLKHREYASRGLPFMYAGNDPDFTDCKWAYNISETEEDVDLKSVMSILEANNFNSVEIKKYSEECLDWRVKVSGILERL